MSLSGLYKSSKSRNVLSEQPRRSCPWCWTHGRFESWNLSSLLSFSAATPGNKCAVWDTWLYLRHYEKSAPLLCRVDSLWQNSGDENLLFLTFLCVTFATVCLSFILSLCLGHTLILSQRVCVFLPPSSLLLMLSVRIFYRIQIVEKQSIMLQHDFSVWWLPYALTLGKCLSNTQKAWNKY